jgi:ribosome modulation factor
VTDEDNIYGYADPGQTKSEVDVIVEPRPAPPSDDGFSPTTAITAIGGVPMAIPERLVPRFPAPTPSHAQERADRLNEIITQGSDCRRRGVAREHCPHADGDEQTSWLIGWDQMDEHLRRRLESRTAPRVTRLEGAIMRAHRALTVSGRDGGGDLVVTNSVGDDLDLEAVLALEGARKIAHEIVRFLGGVDDPVAAPPNRDPDKFLRPGVRRE